ncbi:5868_t:CDS:2, partial [Acaulospora colombiana]
MCLGDDSLTDQTDTNTTNSTTDIELGQSIVRALATELASCLEEGTQMEAIIKNGALESAHQTTPTTEFLSKESSTHSALWRSTREDRSRKEAQRVANRMGDMSEKVDVQGDGDPSGVVSERDRVVRETKVLFEGRSLELKGEVPTETGSSARQPWNHNRPCEFASNAEVAALCDGVFDEKKQILTAYLPSMHWQPSCRANNTDQTTESCRSNTTHNAPVVARVSLDVLKDLDGLRERIPTHGDIGKLGTGLWHDRCMERLWGTENQFWALISNEWEAPLEPGTQGLRRRDKAFLDQMVIESPAYCRRPAAGPGPWRDAPCKALSIGRASEMTDVQTARAKGHRRAGATNGFHSSTLLQYSQAGHFQAILLSHDILLEGLIFRKREQALMEDGQIAHEQVGTGRSLTGELIRRAATHINLFACDNGTRDVDRASVAVRVKSSATMDVFPVEIIQQILQNLRPIIVPTPAKIDDPSVVTNCNRNWWAGQSASSDAQKSNHPLDNTPNLTIDARAVQ